MIAVIDYKTANLGSIMNMLRHIGIDAKVAARPDELTGASHIVMPGIGHFDTCARNLAELGFAQALEEPVLARGIPLLGICVGAQLLTRGSEEGDRPGLGWIAARTRRFPAMPEDPRYKVPHMGWNHVNPTRPHPLFEGFDVPPRAYFVHSYCMECDDQAAMLGETTHGISFASAIGRDNIAGLQFHPEKSHRFGMKMLANFARMPSPAQA